MFVKYENCIIKKHLMLLAKGVRVFEYYGLSKKAYIFAS